ncbi:MAG: LCP family protein [Culicoidibacterales bacterium]
MSEEITRVQKRAQAKQPKMAWWKKVFIGFGIFGAVILLSLGGLYTWKAEQITGALEALDTETKFEETTSKVANTKGILLIGLDNNNGFGNFDHRYTDSLTYVGVNFDTQEIIMLPIYRDARIPMSCDNNREENINRIYDQSDMNCLVQSTANFLNLPIDYYAQTSLDGFTQAVNQFGTISVAASETFCQASYCFNNGQTYEMSAEMAIAYLQYRGGSNGLNRADRQLDVIHSVAKQCLNNPFDCFDTIAPILGEIVKTNVPLTEMTQYLGAVTGTMSMTQLEVIQGTNTQIADGWTQFVDQADLTTKTEHIRQAIFQ